MAWASGGAVDKLVVVAFFTRRLAAVLLPSLLEARSTLALMVTLVVSKGSDSRVKWPCTSANVASSASSMTSSMVEVNERPSAVTVKVKMYFKVVYTGLPEAVEEVRALCVKEWDAWAVRGEVVGAAPGSRDGSCVVIMLEIIEGSVWTRLVHNFVSSVAEEGRMVMVQKMSAEGRGIVGGEAGGEARDGNMDG